MLSILILTYIREMIVYTRLNVCIKLLRNQFSKPLLIQTLDILYLNMAKHQASEIKN